MNLGDICGSGVLAHFFAETTSYGPARDRFRDNDSLEQFDSNIHRGFLSGDRQRQDKRPSSSNVPFSYRRQPGNSGIAESGREHDRPQQRECQTPPPCVVRSVISRRSLPVCGGKWDSLSIPVAPLHGMHGNLGQGFRVCALFTITGMCNEQR